MVSSRTLKTFLTGFSAVLMFVPEVVNRVPQVFKNVPDVREDVLNVHPKFHKSF